MCLSQLVRIEKVDATNARAVGKAGGRSVDVSLAVLALEGDLPVAGDWVQVSTGLAIRILSDDEAAQILAARMEPGGTP
ncbi:MAG: HypC/HybG/HupF family hydrogenase formation chaperone [Acidimicrobiia bacterium]